MSQFRAFDQEWPKDSYFVSKRMQQKLSDQGVANLYPDVQNLFAAHLRFLEDLLMHPAREQGFSQWGVKEVTWGSEHALYLRYFYPKAKFLFLYRNPLDAYASFYRVCDGWFDRWPTSLIATPYAFGKAWARLTEDFLLSSKALGAMLLRYEDLDNKEVIDGLAQYVGWTLPRASELRRLATDKIEIKDVPDTQVPWIDRVFLTFATRRVARLAGYSEKLSDPG